MHCYAFFPVCLHQNSKFWGRKRRNKVPDPGWNPNWDSKIVHSWRSLRSIIRLKLNTPITTTILKTAPCLVNRGNETKPSLVWHLSSVQDMVKKASKHEHTKGAQRFPRFDQDIVRSHRFSVRHVSKAIDRGTCQFVYELLPLHNLLRLLPLLKSRMFLRILIVSCTLSCLPVNDSSFLRKAKNSLACVEVKLDVEFYHSTRNNSRIRQKVGNGVS